MFEIPRSPRILTTTVGSYPVPDWLAALPSEQAVIDATQVIFSTQRQCGIDLPTDGELYRFDCNHPGTNGMIDYFTGRLGGISDKVGRSLGEAFSAEKHMQFRAKPAGVVDGAIEEGSLNLMEDCRRAADVAGGPFKFTVTSPYMLARTLLDRHYGNFDELTLAIADVLAEQVVDLPCSCVQVDEANIPGNPEDGLLAQEAINRILNKVVGKERAVHLCFGNYGGQTIQRGHWLSLTNFLNGLKVDHLALELAHRPEEDLAGLKEIDPSIKLGVGVVDVKINHVETAEEIARRLEKIEKTVGEGRLRYVHPDCGFWMLKRSIANRKMSALAAGRNLYLGIRD